MDQKQIFPTKSDDCCSTHHTGYRPFSTASRDDHDGHDHGAGNTNPLLLFLPAIISFALLLSAIALDNLFPVEWFTGGLRLAWYIAAYLPVGFPVIKDALVSIGKGDVFSEFFLMAIATLGAFAIGEYPEGVAVMLFYAIGEGFQSLAVKRAKTNIKMLLDQRPDEVSRITGEGIERVKAEHVRIGDVLQLKPGEKLGLDGDLLSETASFNTAALTGESVPDTKMKGEPVLAGMINLNTLSTVKVTARYADSKLSRILELTQEATAQKAPTELFIRRFARIYTPAVVALAILLCAAPALFIDDYVFSTWFYRALVFLVISCPCALVISIPLGYFGGIGAASRNGILVKGGNFLDKLAGIRNVVMDKTGTMTEGVFKVREIVWMPGIDGAALLPLVNALESYSTHPVATAIHEYAGPADRGIPLGNVEEIPGYGLKAEIGGKQILAGNFRLMDASGIRYDLNPDEIVSSIVAIAFDGNFAGHIEIADQIKADAPAAIADLRKLNVKAIMLSGDKASVVQHVAEKLGIDEAYGELLPADKVEKVKIIKSRNESVAFVGDGLNDAPVIALSDVGIAMGGLGSDATIETADIVIQDDRPSKIPMAIRIGRNTKKIVWQNIFFAFAVKALVLMLGAGGIATMWEAVFADVGVSLLAVLNATRIQRMQF